MSLLPGRSRPRPGRGLHVVELAVVVSLGATSLAVAVPTFAREIHASRLVEPIDGLHKIGAGALAYAQAHPAAQAFPPSAAMTPAAPPRGHCEPDPPGTWDGATWRALDFRPADEGVPHCFSFGFESALSPARSGFRAQAHGDLDGDGITSTFEITGQSVEGDPRGPLIDPGMYVEAEVE